MVKIGTVTLTNGTSFLPGNLTVLVGPNNGGKSRFLKDLVSAFGSQDTQRKSVGHVERLYAGRYPLAALLESLPRDANGNYKLDVLETGLGPTNAMRMTPHTFQTAVTTDNPEGVFQYLYHRHIAYLKTESRLSVLKRQVNKTADFYGGGSMIELAWDARERISEEIKEGVRAAFGLSLELNHPSFSELEYLLSGAEGEAPEALDDQGDGIRSFCAILVAITVLNRSVIAVDEPEAFLHPPQAYLIGRALAQKASVDKQLFIATHSADVLRGILSVTNDVQILRMSRHQREFRTKQLQTETLQQIIADPLLSSSRVLDGLFYNGVILTESDGDVVLYRTVLEKFETTASLHFVNAYSKLQASKVAVPYQAMGVPFAIVLDFDILSEQGEFRQVFTELGGDWTEVLPLFEKIRRSVLHLHRDPLSNEERLQQALSTIYNSLEGVAGEPTPDKQLNFFKHRLDDARKQLSAWAKLKASGFRGLSGEGKEAFTALDLKCRQRGLFIVSVGEREAWLVPEVPYTTNKNKWTRDAIKFLTATPLSEEAPLRKFVSDIRFQLLPT
jgi:predicted ATPase